MGLELTEIMLAVEEEFEVRKDDEFVDLRTVGGLYNWICEQVATRPYHKCRRLAAFLRTRRALAEFSGKAARQISLDTPLEMIVPRRRRRKAWKELEQSLEHNLPPLERPRPINWLNAGLTLVFMLTLMPMAAILIVTASSLTDLFGGVFVAFVILFFCTPLFAFVLEGFTLPFARIIPSGCATPRSIVLNTTRGELATPARERTPEEIWSTLVDIISTKLDVKPEVLTADTRFTEDLEAY